MFSKSKVEEIISRIIHQDSFGDVHFEAQKIAKEYGLNFSSLEKEAMEMFGVGEVEGIKELVGVEGLDKSKRMLEEEGDTVGLEILNYLFQP